MGIETGPLSIKWIDERGEASTVLVWPGYGLITTIAVLYGDLVGPAKLGHRSHDVWHLPHPACGGKNSTQLVTLGRREWKSSSKEKTLPGKNTRVILFSESIQICGKWDKSLVGNLEKNTFRFSWCWAQN
jgi:hypothetical protein